MKQLADASKWTSYATPSKAKIGAIGEIEMWGRVLEYKDGYRSEYAYPLRIWIPETANGYEHEYSWGSMEELAEKLWMQYLVEVNISDEVVYDLNLREDK